ncbi:MAG: helix-turn-helix transcriptional regulator [Marinobacter sp.]
MLRETNLAEVLDAIYFATHKQDGWQDCLDIIRQFSRSDTAQLLILNKDGGQVIAGYQSRNLRGHELDPGSSKANVCVWDTRGEVEGGLLQLRVQRAAVQGAFGEDERAIIDGLMPHIVRAMRQEEASRVLNDRQAAVRQQKNGGLLLLNGNYYVVFHSSQAERLISQSPSVSLKNGHLHLARQRDQVELEGLIRGCLDGKESGMMVLGDGGPQGLRLMVSAVQSHDEALFQFHDLVSVFIVGDQTEEGAEEHMLGQWLGLTESESRIATLIANGRRPGDIAVDLSVSVHTVRHHIKNIYRKTGAHSQSQLTALVLNLPISARE